MKLLKFLSLKQPQTRYFSPKSCESAPNQAFPTPNIKNEKFVAKTHDPGGI